MSHRPLFLFLDQIPTIMENIITSVALAVSVAGLGYLKMEQMDRLEAKSMAEEAARIEAEAQMQADEDLASRAQFEVPHDSDAESVAIDIVLDGTTSYDMESDSLSFAWKQLEGPSVTLSEDAPGLSSFKAGAGTYTFELTVTDNYGAATTGQARLAVMPEPNNPPEVAMSVYTRPASEE